jgi:hypothetical protein
MTQKPRPELYRFNDIVDVLSESLDCPDEKHKCFSPQTADFWSIHENQLMLEILKNDPDLPLRAFMYLKKIKYLQLDVRKYSQTSKERGLKATKLKVECGSLKSRINILKYKLQKIESEKETKKVLGIPYSKTFESTFYLPEMEDHFNEFKSKDIVKDVIDGSHTLITRALLKLTKTILGFYNADGGKLYIGIEDDGYATGINFNSKRHLDDFLKQIDNALTFTSPPIYQRFYTYEFWNIDNATAVIVTVPPSKQEPKQMTTIKYSDQLFIRRNALTAQYRKTDYDGGYCDF